MPGPFAASGMALGLVLGLLAVWRRASEPAVPAVAVDRHVADEPPPWPLAPPPADGDPSPGWYPAPRHSGARRYWDGDGLTEPTTVVDGTQATIVAWYDNEWG